MVIWNSHIFIQGQNRNTLSVLKTGNFPAIVPHHHMQHYSIVNRVKVVPVSPPIVAINVDLYITPGQPASGRNHRIPEISPPVVIDPAWIDYL